MRDVLRADDDDRAVERQQAHQLLLDVGRAGRQVDEQVVELAPVGLVHELAEHELDRHRRERQRLILGDEEADRHELQPVHVDRRQRDRPAEPPQLQLACALAPRQADHQREVGAVEVGVEHADGGAVAGEGEGEIERQRRLADAALAAGDRDDTACGRLRHSPIMVIGVIPAAGHATRLGGEHGSKEAIELAGRPLLDYLVESLRAAPCSEIRLVTRPEKADVIELARARGLTVIVASPENVARSLALGVAGCDDEDVVCFGFPDCLWEPVDGFATLVAAVERGDEIALGLFRTNEPESYDPVVLADPALAVGARRSRRGEARTGLVESDLGLRRRSRPRAPSARARARPR